MSAIIDVLLARKAEKFTKVNPYHKDQVLNEVAELQAKIMKNDAILSLRKTNKQTKARNKDV